MDFVFLKGVKVVNKPFENLFVLAFGKVAYGGKAARGGDIRKQPAVYLAEV